MQWFLKVMREYATFEDRTRRTAVLDFMLFHAIFSVTVLAVDFGLVQATGFRVLTVLYLLG